jgi:DNA-binding transcriptional LysR family regulator
MNITLAQIRAFERIVRLGSFHAAGRELGPTQPSVFSRSRELEEELGARLFIRRGPNITMTAAAAGVGAGPVSLSEQLVLAD